MMVAMPLGYLDNLSLSWNQQCWIRLGLNGVDRAVWTNCTTIFQFSLSLTWLGNCILGEPQLSEGLCPSGRYFVPGKSSLAVLAVLVLLGCSPASTPPGTVAPPAPAVVATAAPQPAAEPDLSVPVLAPKPVIWMEDWKAPETSPTMSEMLTTRADLFKSLKRYDGAEKLYQRAIEADPQQAYPVYQLACNYELAGKHAEAAAMFEKAVEIGFSDFPTALADNELGKIRERPDFEKTLAKIRERYIATAAERVGQPIAIRPEGKAPENGWPLMLLLHGYGDTNISYLDQAEQWAKSGFVAVAVPGTVPAQGGRFMWDLESTEPTRKNLQAIVDARLFEGHVDRQRVFLLGFSQGALHAMLLTAEHPELYAGVVGLSPGGSLSQQLIAPTLKGAERPPRCYFIHGTEEPHAPIVRIWSSASQKAGWKFSSATHRGGHHFPENWDELQLKVAEFLLR